MQISFENNTKNAENFSTKALAIKLCYLEIDEVHWLMKGYFVQYIFKMDKPAGMHLCKYTQQ